MEYRQRRITELNESFGCETTPKEGSSYNIESYCPISILLCIPYILDRHRVIIMTPFLENLAYCLVVIVGLLLFEVPKSC